MYQHNPDTGKQAPWKTCPISNCKNKPVFPVVLHRTLKESRKVETAHNMHSCKISINRILLRRHTELILRCGESNLASARGKQPPVATMAVTMGRSEWLRDGDQLGRVWLSG